MMKRKFAMNTKFVLRNSVVVLAIAAVLGGSLLPTNAFAVGGALDSGRIVTDANAKRSDRVRQAHERGHEWQPQRQGGYEWDPWGHRGGYYGPNGIL
jgi:hypothetical protein